MPQAIPPAANQPTREPMCELGSPHRRRGVCPQPPLRRFPPSVGFEARQPIKLPASRPLTLVCSYRFAGIATRSPQGEVPKATPSRSDPHACASVRVADSEAVGMYAIVGKRAVAGKPLLPRCPSLRARTDQMGASRPPLRNLTALHMTPSLVHHGCAAAELALWTLGLRGIRLLVSTACVCSPASMVAASTNCVSLT